MDLFKKNPVFCTLCIVALLAFAGGSTLVVMESGKLSKSKKLVANADSQIKGLLYAEPAPTMENVKAAEANAAELRAMLVSMREELERGSRLTISNDSVRVMSGLQQYISEYRQQAAAHVNEKGDPAPIALPNDFAFGFEKYLKKSGLPEDPVVVALLDKQRQVLSYILNQLITSDPKGIQSVEREVLEEKGGEKVTGFRINPAVSARVPGAIDTLAFRVTFTGDTRALRKFLNKLAQFDLPIVVRSVMADRPSANAKQAKDKKGKKNNLDDIFSSFGGNSSNVAASKESTSPANQTPVVSETESSFTVTLEFIEIILPSNSEENPS